MLAIEFLKRDVFQYKMGVEYISKKRKFTINMLNSGIFVYIYINESENATKCFDTTMEGVNIPHIKSTQNMQTNFSSNPNAAACLTHSYCSEQPHAKRLAPFFSGAKSIVGLPEKKLSGFNVKPVTSQGMTGKSSMRGTCTTPNECHNTNPLD